MSEYPEWIAEPNNKHPADPDRRHVSKCRKVYTTTFDGSLMMAERYQASKSLGFQWIIRIWRFVPDHTAKGKWEPLLFQRFKRSFSADDIDAKLSDVRDRLEAYLVEQLL